MNLPRRVPRELREETGYSANTFKKLAEILIAPAISTERMHAFIATGLTHVGQDLDVAEKITPEIVPLDRVKRMLISGQILDSKTIAVLGMYLLGEER